MTVTHEHLTALEGRVNDQLRGATERLTRVEERQANGVDARSETRERIATLEAQMSNLATDLGALDHTTQKLGSDLAKATGDFGDIVKMLKEERDAREAAAKAKADAEKEEQKQQALHRKAWREFTEPVNLMKSVVFLISVLAIAYAFATGSQSPEDIARAAKLLAEEQADMVRPKPAAQPAPVEVEPANEVP